MAQHGNASNTALPESPTIETTLDEVMAQLAAMQTELQAVKAENKKLRMGAFGKLLDEDNLEYEIENAEDAAQATGGAAAPAMPASFLMTPEKLSGEASWAAQGWTDWSRSAAPTVQPPHQPPGFGLAHGRGAPLVDPCSKAARMLEKSTGEAS